MKENRHKYMDDCADKRKQSAELNKELGQIWQKMSRDEQQPYYEMAQQKREEHQRLYPNWTARENYAIHKKAKKRRTRERSLENNEQKKCRARFGIDNVIKWCKHCKRKKRCLNVRDSDSPAQVSSTTNPTTPLSLGGAHLHNQQGQSSSNGHQNSQFGHSLGGLFNLNQTQQHQQQQKQPLDSPMSSQKGQSTNSELSRCSSSASSESLESDVSEDKDDSQQTMEGLETSPMQKHNGGNIKTYKMETSDPIPSPHTPPSHLRRKHQHHNHQQQQSPLSVDTPKHLLSLNNAGMDNLLAAAAASSLLPHHSSPFSSPSTNSILQQNVPSAFQMPPGTPTGFPFQNPFMPFGMNFMPFMKP
uniref:HMG box domain-containing protein n=1 Tax=Meloidogyne hapla TaxID=6305 RepID=A0A1I8BI13_MELHA